LPGDFWAQRLRDTIVVRRPLRRGQQLPDPVELRIPGTTRFGSYRIDAQILDAGQIEPAAITGKKNPFQEYLDLGRIRPPLVVRPRRPGDRFVPLGQHSQKKVGKFLTATKVPDNLRSRAFVIEDVQAILWVCPIRISDRAKVTENTSIILDLSVAEV